jgi:hypothetical protein
MTPSFPSERVSTIPRAVHLVDAGDLGADLPQAARHLGVLLDPAAPFGVLFDQGTEPSLGYVQRIGKSAFF